MRGRPSLEGRKVSPVKLSEQDRPRFNRLKHPPGASTMRDGEIERITESPAVTRAGDVLGKTLREPRTVKIVALYQASGDRAQPVDGVAVAHRMRIILNCGSFASAVPTAWPRSATIVQ